MVKGIIEAELAAIVTEGVQYEKIGGSVYSLTELQQDGIEEKQYFLDNLYKVKNREKTDYDFVVYDSEAERRFAELLDDREDIKLFLKLPPKFKVDTRVRAYNPDWAILKQVDGEDKLYTIRETKSTMVEYLLRTAEQAKIDAAHEHFKTIGVDYVKEAPGELEYIGGRKFDDFLARTTSKDTTQVAQGDVMSADVSDTAPESILFSRLFVNPVGRASRMLLGCF
ncbi:hypothetical protein [Corynebacterium sp. UMB4614]|uniref:restriction endonuclease n=1 Tax=Corynebacterium sp. UMB4614 TaxID=3046334 RepID=UPI00254BAA93|nr:hypothetical protein [Corynebacterium sp. UMB4614]MDK7135426.1 hypothetical protein [Corynebacterium sp. UMB4614]